MAKEIERKFLVKDNTWRGKGEGTGYRQGYLSTEKGRTVRIRIAGSKGYLTIKGISVGMTRNEFEYEIPLDDASQMLDELCDKPLIEKIRYRIAHSNLIWEVDEFYGENHGLILAEVELESEDQQAELPEWIGEEVTGDPRYFNSNLIKSPYSTWKIKNE